MDGYSGHADQQAYYGNNMQYYVPQQQDQQQYYGNNMSYGYDQGATQFYGQNTN